MANTPNPALPVNCSFSGKTALISYSFFRAIL
jgi:hypothetical protein